jgi:hypothetical protein
VRSKASQVASIHGVLHQLTQKHAFVPVQCIAHEQLKGCRAIHGEFEIQGFITVRPDFEPYFAEPETRPDDLVWAG